MIAALEAGHLGTLSATDGRGLRRGLPLLSASGETTTTQLLLRSVRRMCISKIVRRSYFPPSSATRTNTQKRRIACSTCLFRFAPSGFVSLVFKCTKFGRGPRCTFNRIRTTSTVVNTSLLTRVAQRYVISALDDVAKVLKHTCHETSETGVPRKLQFLGKIISSRVLSPRIAAWGFKSAAHHPVHAFI